jgi:hypothetical protein
VNTKWQWSQFPSQKTQNGKFLLSRLDYLLPYKTHLIDKHKHWLRMKGWKKFYQSNGAWKQEVVPILISDKSYFKPEIIRRHKEGHFILIKVIIHKEEIIISIILIIGKPNFVKEMLLDFKPQTDSNTVIAGYFIAQLSQVYRSFR